MIVIIFPFDRHLHFPIFLFDYQVCKQYSIQSQFHNKIFTIDNSQAMYNLSKITELISLDNQECNCFGNATHPQDQFLIKQTNPKPTPLSHSQIAAVDQSFTKSAAKRSLRRPNANYFQQKNKERVMYMHQSQSRHLLPHTFSTRQLAQFTSPQRIRNNYHENPPLLPRETPYHPYPSQQNFHPLHHQEQSFTTFPPPQMQPALIANPIPNFSIAPFQPVSPVKVIYNKQIPEVSTKNAIEKKTCIKEDMRKQERSPTNASRNEPQSLTNIQRQAISTPKLSKTQFLQSIPSLQRNDANSVNSQPSQNNFYSPQSNSEQQFFFESEFNPQALKYSWQGQNSTTPKDFNFSQPSRVTWKMPHDRHSLKKMNDVMEICSQADSQDDSNSGKESIVVGRLNEYASMVEPKVESTSMIHQNIQNRLAGIGSLNSTIGHCQTKKKDQICI